MAQPEDQHTKFNRLYDAFLKLSPDQRVIVSRAYAKAPDGTGNGDALEMAFCSLTNMEDGAVDYDDILAGQAIYEALEG